MLILNEADHFRTLQLITEKHTLDPYARRQAVRFLFIVAATTSSYALGIVQPDAVITQP